MFGAGEVPIGIIGSFGSEGIEQGWLKEWGEEPELEFLLLACFLLFFSKEKRL